MSDQPVRYENSSFATSIPTLIPDIRLLLTEACALPGVMRARARAAPATVRALPPLTWRVASCSPTTSRVSASLTRTKF